MFAASMSPPHKKEEPEEFEEGDVVEYHPVGSSPVTSFGRITSIMTHPETFEPRHIVPKASEEHPRYIIHNLHTDKESPYKKEAIVRKTSMEEAQEHVSQQR